MWSAHRRAFGSLATRRLFAAGAAAGGKSAGGHRALSPAEAAIAGKLVEKFKPAEVHVEDVSGGCGSMYSIKVVSTAFAGLSKLQQHRQVNEALADDIKQWHGLQLTTSAPAPSS